MTTEQLRDRIRGSVITALDPRMGTESDGMIWNGRKPARRARLIVRVASAEDVQEAVRYAAANGLKVSARGGGHQFSGLASQADMVIDLGGLDGLRLDAEAMTARVEPGVTNTRMAAALDRHDLAFPLGHCGSVPMSGFLLGGGVGWNSAEWGYAWQSVLSAEVVLADGRMVTASATENPDIYWAVRGAGPEFFGIVVAYHLRLHPAARAITTVIRIYPAAAVAAVAAWAEAAMASAPSKVEFTAKIVGSPHGPVIAAIATVFARTEEEAGSVHAALGTGAPEALEVIGPMPTPFAALYEATAESTPWGRRYLVDTLWSDARFGDVLARIVHEMGTAPSTESVAILSLKPASAIGVPTDAAFSRHGRICGILYGIWQEEADDAANIAWLRAAIDAVAPLCTGAYVGEADLERPDRALPTHTHDVLARLAELRRTYDPAGRFTTAAAVTSRLIAAE
ncbi:FAD-binding protein [Rhodobacterales bacterium HKCCE3408]|nr:FAD-binding protein [Rhodobacterales bacterium HKCCE3408]